MAGGVVRLLDCCVEVEAVLCFYCEKKFFFFSFFKRS